MDEDGGQIRSAEKRGERLRDRLRPGFIGFWVLGIIYFGVQFVYAFGPYIFGWEYLFGFIRSWSVMLGVLWIGAGTVAFLRASVSRRAIVALPFLALALGGYWFFEEGRRLRAALDRTERIVVGGTLFYWEEGAEEHTAERYELTVISNDSAIERMKDSLAFDQDSPWAIVHYFTDRGDYTLELMDADDKMITTFSVINRGEAIGWKWGMNSDRRASPEFSEALVEAVFESLSTQGVETLSERRRTQLARALSWCATPASTRRLGSMINDVDSPYWRRTVAVYLGSYTINGVENARETAVGYLIRLTEDPAPLVRKRAIFSLSIYADASESARSAILDYDLEGETDSEVAESVRHFQERLAEDVDDPESDKPEPSANAERGALD